MSCKIDPSNTHTTEDRPLIDLVGGGLAPKEIVDQLNRHVVGHLEAKRAVANALRNRLRRRYVELPLREEITPKNILMKGPTGVGKTEIARRLAKLLEAPFVKVEATKYTEVGYVGRDVDSMIRDLLDNALEIVRKRKRKEVAVLAEKVALDIIVTMLSGKDASLETRKIFTEKLKSGELDEKEVEIEITDNNSKGGLSTYDIPGAPGGQMGIVNMNDFVNKMLGRKQTKKKTMSVKEALEILSKEESDKLIDEDTIVKEAITLTENEGIIFLDEVDKIAVNHTIKGGGDVSREGVQRDLLPLVEGTAVSTKYGCVKTDYILFIASGAFHLSKPSDLLPEMQGRFPVRVELSSLTLDDMVKILTEPESSAIKQYQALLMTEGVKLEFCEDGIKSIAELAISLNKELEDIGARRLHAILEKLLAEVSFDACDMKNTTVKIDSEYVKMNLKEFSKWATDLHRFIL